MFSIENRTGSGFSEFVSLSPLVVRNTRRAAAIFLTSLAVAACAQSSSVTNKAGLISDGRQTSLEGSPARAAVPNKHLAVRQHAPSATLAHPAEDKGATYGVASYYSEGTQTASGERFNPEELTAAHPSLPFGTHLRVTNLATGQSVVVRVNDRGPFVSGRTVDVSRSAAAAIGMVDRGTAKVKLDVVQ
jgi:rare lipoprotein A